MAALLTASSNTREKIEKYRENCQRMGINVRHPDINLSQEDFMPIDDKTILFGLSAVKNLGQGAIENILQARQTAGKFKSLADFCDRVELRTVNSRALETLIHCGAFDRLQLNRRQLINDLELIIPWAQKKAKDKESGQLNLFDLMGNNHSDADRKQIFEPEPTTLPVEDYPLQEKLRLEKEYLGFYVSDHPLKAIHQAAQILSPINLSQLAEQKSRQQVSAVVMLTAVKKYITQKGTPMAFLQMEDVTGEAEGTVFPSTYEKIESLLQENNRLIVWGKAQARNDKYQFIIDDAEPVERVKLMMLEMTPEQALDRAKQNYLKSVLQEQSQDKSKIKIPVIAIIGRGEQRQFVRFGHKFWVEDETKTISTLQQAGFNVHTELLISS
jgi:DNA polymerase-3 subunit alpha